MIIIIISIIVCINIIIVIIIIDIVIIIIHVTFIRERERGGKDPTRLAGRENCPEVACRLSKTSRNNLFEKRIYEQITIKSGQSGSNLPRSFLVPPSSYTTTSRRSRLASLRRADVMVFWASLCVRSRPDFVRIAELGGIHRVVKQSVQRPTFHSLS